MSRISASTGVGKNRNAELGCLAKPEPAAAMLKQNVIVSI